MSEGRQQTMMEVWPIARHLKELREKYECENFQCVFLAPSIFVDSENQIDWVKMCIRDRCRVCQTYITFCG